MDDAASHPAFRRRAGDGPVFTSRKCPPAPGLKHSCELPFGFIWTPMSQSNTVALVATAEERGEALPPVLCLTCLAYINLYATFDESTGTWICPLCGQENVAPQGIFHSERESKSQLSLALVSPVVEYRQGVNDASSFDGAMDSLSYVLVLDGNLPCDEVKSVVTEMQKLLLEEANRGIRVQLGLVVYDQMVSIYQLGLIGMASADVYPPLQNDAEEIDDEVLIKRRQRMENRSYFVHVRSEEDIAILWLCVSAVYGLQVQQVNAGGTEQDPSEAGELSRKDKLRIQKEARLRKQLSGSLELEAAAKATAVKSPWISDDNSPALRCTWDATHCAVDLAIFGSYHAPRSSRVLLFTNGCPNIGIGSVVNRDLTEETPQQNGLLRPTPHSIDVGQMTRSVEYFELTGKYAMESGVGVDVFCSGAEFLAMPAYQALVRPSGGYALAHDSFSSPQLAHNLRYIVLQTHMSIADCEGVMDNLSSSTMNELQGCLVDLRISSFVTPTHVVGAGEIFNDDNQGLLLNERSAFALGASLAASRGFATNNIPSSEFLASTLTRIRLGRYDPLATITAMLQVNDEIHADDRYAIFQCTVRFIDPASQELVTRVSTNRLPVSLSVNDFLESMDEEAVPVVLGKEAVYRSIVGRDEKETAAADMERIEFLAYEAQRDLDATVHRISGAFRLLGLEEGNLSSSFGDRILTEEGGIAASTSSLDFAFPPELADALHRLFHLRRGALLSPGPLQSADDRAEMRSLFLRLPLDDCLCIMAPSLWSAETKEINGEISLEPIPSDTLTLWDNRIIAADHHDTLFVWSGRGVVGSEFNAIRDHCKEFLLERSNNRFPMPRLHSLDEGDSMSRRFTARLAPSHADPVEQQLVHFPALATLSPSELTALREKFRFYDAATDASFRRWFWEVASASSSARDEGMSLCQ